jgi:hypothetical protein
MSDVLGCYNEYVMQDFVKDTYTGIVAVLRREYGVFKLPVARGAVDANHYHELINFFVYTDDVEKCLDVVEMCFDAVNTVAREFEYRYGASRKIVDSSIAELNYRFRESAVGYQFEDGEIIRVDSQLLHQEAVKPAIALLNTDDYEGPQEEFLAAYEHYRLGNNKEALTDALKAFESTMKAICDKRGWAYDPKTATAKPLIDIMFANGLVPSFWQQQFNSLRSLLESSIPTGRNKLSGHGQGAVPTEVPDYLTAYMLHMTASTLVFLTTAEKELP